jgi:hypothetical protein
MLNVTVSDLAPDLMEVIEPPPGGCTAAAPNTTTVSYWQQGAAFTVTGGSEQMSAYTLGGGGLTPTPAPGRPPESFQQTHSWRRWCPGCHKEYIESSTSRAPLICDACGGPVRASVQVTVTKTQ